MGRTGRRSLAWWRYARAGVLLLGLSQPPLTSRADEALNQRVEALLTAGIETEAQHASIASLGAGAQQALMQVFEREAAPRYVRLRALSALATFGTSTGARYFERLVRAAERRDDSWLGPLHPARSPLVLRRALEGLLETARTVVPALDAAPISACLAHPDAHVRDRAARLLELLDDPSAGQALIMHLTRERSPMVRGRLQQAITSRSARRVAPR